MINSLKSPTVDGASDGMLPTTSCSLPSSSGISSLRVPTDSSKEKRLLPFGRLARSIKPRIGGLPWTTKGCNNLSGRKLGKRFGEGHGQILPPKKKYAMQKINLDKCPQCRQSLRMSNTKHRFTKVSEYIAAGALEVGFVLESPTRETEKALGFKGVKFNSYGNAYDAVIWLPKSQLQKLENDFYTNDAPAVMWFCPSWLYAKNPTLGEVAA